MKQLFTLIGICFSLTAFCQATGTSEVFVFQPVSSQRVRTTDSVQVFATLVTNHTVTSIGWTQLAGPSLAFAPTTSWYGGSVATGSFWLSNLAVGTYVFKATGLSSSGTTGSVTDTLTVLAAPAPRLVTSVALTVDGVSILVPASALPAGSIKFNDGSAQ